MIPSYHSCRRDRERKALLRLTLNLSTHCVDYRNALLFYAFLSLVLTCVSPGLYFLHRTVLYLFFSLLGYLKCL